MTDIHALRIRFEPSGHSGGRETLLCGTVAVGAVFPPTPPPTTRRTAKPQAPGRCRWRVWVTANGIPREGSARCLAAAREAALEQFRAFLDAARLVPEQEGA